jgi:ubiquinone/menaquinone biosynthesis C-methylase UbiE
MNSERQQHWQNIYELKKPDELSWTEEKPGTSLELIHSFNLPKTASIIDVGGGDSKLVDYLLADGFSNITVLDISANALYKAKQRLGEQSKKVKWIVSDITDFTPFTTYDIWHDRAAFHFLTLTAEIKKYIDIAARCIKSFMVLATFSTVAPKKCSGLDVEQYNEQTLPELFANHFEKLKCLREDHVTPFATKKNFLF